MCGQPLNWDSWRHKTGNNVLYNNITNGTANSLIIDSRDSESFEHSHIWGAILVFPFFFFFPFSPLHLTRCKKARLFYFHMNKSRILPTQTHFGRDSVCCMFGKCQRSASLLLLYRLIRICSYRNRRDALLWHFPIIYKPESRTKCGFVGRIRDLFKWK